MIEGKAPGITEVWGDILRWRGDEKLDGMDAVEQRLGVPDPAPIHVWAEPLGDGRLSLGVRDLDGAALDSGMSDVWLGSDAYVAEFLQLLTVGIAVRGGRMVILPSGTVGYLRACEEAGFEPDLDSITRSLQEAGVEGELDAILREEEETNK